MSFAQFNASPNKLNDGLLAFWDFNSDYKDKSENGFDAVPMNDAERKLTKSGAALYLDGDGDYLKIDRKFNLPNEYTVSVWVKSDDIAREYAAIFAKYETNYFGPFDFSLHYGVPNLWLSDGEGGHVEVDAETKLEAGKWYHIAFVVRIPVEASKHRGPVLNHQLKIYINGELETEAAVPPVLNNKDEVTIGRQSLLYPPDMKAANYKLQYKGFIDELRIYGKPLSEMEISALYHLDKLKFENS